MKTIFHVYATWAVLMALFASFVSCAKTETTVTGYSRGGQPMGTAKVTQFVWGKLNAEVTPFGLVHSGNLDIGFKYFTQAVVSLAGAIYYGRLQLANETTKQLQNAGMTQVQIAQLNADLQKSLATIGFEQTKAAINRGLFTPAGAVFKQ
jgi:hypothetical protein